MNIKKALLFIFSAAQLSAATIQTGQLYLVQVEQINHTDWYQIGPAMSYADWNQNALIPFLFSQVQARTIDSFGVVPCFGGCALQSYTAPPAFPPGQNPGSATPEPATFALVGMALGLAAAFQVSARKLEKRYRVACVQCDGEAKFIGVVDGVYGEGPVCGACRDGGGV